MENGLFKESPIKLLAISGSPRKNGNSQFLLDTVLQCVKDQKFDVEVTCISLAEYKISPCLGCLACYKNGGKCILQDRFEEARRLWKEADSILYCTPVYVAGIPGQLKCFIDRLSNVDYGLPIRGTRHMKTIGVLAQGGDFFGGGAELCMVDIMRHAAMMNCVYIPPDTSYIGAGGWVWDSHTNAMKEKAKLMTEDYKLTIETSRSVVKRSIEMAAILKHGTAELKEQLEKDQAYQYYYNKCMKQEE